jgi:hypothetical protein
MNAKFKWFILNLCLLFPLLLYSQGEFNNWYFQSLAGLTFNSGYPVPLTNSGMLGSGINITVSDSLGNLLFLSNSQVVLNRNQHVMPNGMLFGTGCLCGTQQVISVQRLDNVQMYYLFYVNTWTGNYPAYGLRYSILNMNLDGGLGDIEPTQKNISVPGMSRAWSAVTATRHLNNRFAWIATRISNPDSNYFASFLVDQYGLNTNAVLSPSLIATKNPPNPVTARQIRISSDGTKLVCIYNADTLAAEFCHFNRETGFVTPLFTFMPSPYNSNLTKLRGLEFSIEGKFLYVSTKCDNQVAAPLYQYDATKTDSAQFMQSETLIAAGEDLFQPGMQMGPDGKIYITHNEIDSLHVINHPSLQGPSCDLEFNAVSLAGRQCYWGLDQFIQRYYVLIHPSDLVCSYSPVTFTSSIWPQPDTIRWDFGDPSSGSFNFSNLPNPTHIYSNSGTYTIELYVRHRYRLANDHRASRTSG